MIYLIDGNAYINVAVNVIKKILVNDKSIRDEYYIKDIFNEDQYILKETARIQFRDFCLNYLTSLISPIHNEVDEVHIVFDSKSWRKEYVDSFFQQAHSLDLEFKYKSGRKTDMIYLFFEYFQSEIQKHLEKNVGINFHRVEGMEGDDLIALLHEKLKNKNVAIYTVDKDMIQLVENSKNYTFLVMPKMMTKHKKIMYTEKTTQNHTGTNDFFSLDETDVSNNIDNIISKFEKKGYKRFNIDPTRELLTKIFGGDKSDSIPRIYKMTPSKVKQITEYLLEMYPSDLIQRIDNYLNEDSILDESVSKMIEINKIKDEDVISKLKDHLILNIRIIRLSTNMIPNEVKNQEYQALNENVLHKKFNFFKLIELKNKSVII
jgi:hypothetical protein